MSQKQAAQAFFQGLSKDLKPDERQARTKAFNEEQYQARVAFHDSQHQDKMSKMREDLAKKTNLTDDKKSALIALEESLYQESKTFFEKQHQASLNFFNSLVSEGKAEGDQKRLAVQQFSQTQMQENQVFMQQQRETRQAKMKEIFPPSSGNQGNNPACGPNTCPPGKK
ncbi:MAG: hypothetical protein HQM09_07700 [Candidatus Riflebacteria bacterium]|nr:hypothetical protein [Candidatus Riflebacteria bacterium]